MEKTQRTEKEEEKREEKKPKLEQSIEKEEKKGEEKKKKERTVLFSYNIVMTVTSNIWEQFFTNFCSNYKVYFISELCQNTWSINDRGVAYTLDQLTYEQKKKGVVAVSSGSFAYTLAYFGEIFNIPVTLIMRTDVEENFLLMCKNRKAEVITEDDIMQAHKLALNIAQKEGKVYLDGNDHPNMIIGQSTLALEIVEEANFDAVVLPTLNKVCELTVGIAMALKELKPSIEVMIVQNQLSNSSISRIREQTNSSVELNIPVLTYNWNKMTTAKLELCRDSMVIMRPSEYSSYVATEYLNLKYGNADCNAALALAALLADKFKGLRGKKIAIPMYGKMDYFFVKKDLADITISQTANTEVAGPSRRS
ncbi:PREDICTED: serine racemase-like [Vollenhovia emeryi]|uniref:serine racemase-like n=1 Tax=Vollenhovia emeryi TaxID=411798 RepID=UPI0005F4E115|nr:PREDICTED: serine racemase-like [Vollenhovia emeryi]